MFIKVFMIVGIIVNIIRIKRNIDMVKVFFINIIIVFYVFKSWFKFFYIVESGCKCKIVFVYIWKLNKV